MFLLQEDHLCPEMHAMTKMADLAKELHNLTKLAILAIFCQFRQISSSTGINTPWVNIDDFGDFGEFDKIGNFGDLLPISSN